MKSGTVGIDEAWVPQGAARRIICPFGHEYSADPRDYWNHPGNFAFTCDCQGVTPCDLVENICLTGTFDGRIFGASGWVTLVEGATVADLEVRA